MSIDIDSICKGFCIMFHNEPINIYIYIYIYMAVSHLLNCAPHRPTFRGNLQGLFLLMHLTDRLLHRIRTSATKP